MTEHTPGPWEVSINPDWTPHSKWAVSREITIRPAGEHPHGLWIADCGLSVNDKDMANARLIAAAPDLLAACQAYKKRYHPSGPPSDGQQLIYTMACAAVAKAT